MRRILFRSTIACIAWAFCILFTCSPAKADVYGLWNLNIGMTNILEIANISTARMTIHISAYNNTGEEAGTMSVTLNANEQRDIILKDTVLQSQPDNSYGLLIIKDVNYFTVKGRVVSYRVNGPDVEFAVNTPLRWADGNISYLYGNDHQASRNVNDQTNGVDQFLSLASCEASGSADYIVRVYNYDGTLIDTFNTSLSAHERKDFPINYGEDGNTANKITSLQVVAKGFEFSEDPAPCFTSALFRYGKKSGDNSFGYAAVVQNTGPSEMAADLRISTESSVFNYVEIANGSNTESWVDLTAYNKEGDKVFEESFIIKPLAQRHLDVTTFFPTNTTGILHVVPRNNSTAIASQSVFYYHDDQGRIIGANVTRAMEFEYLDDGPTYSSYNSFHNSENYYRLYNLNSDGSASLDVIVYDIDGHELSTINVRIPAMGHVAIPLHDPRYKIVPNSYGMVKTDSWCAFAEIVRLGNDTDGKRDYVVTIDSN